MLSDLKMYFFLPRGQTYQRHDVLGAQKYRNPPQIFNKNIKQFVNLTDTVANEIFT